MFNHGGEDECFRDDTSHWDVYRPSAIEAVKLKDGAERDTHTGVFFFFYVIANYNTDTLHSIRQAHILYLI